MPDTRAETLRGENVRIHSELVGINELAAKESRALTAEEQSKWETLHETFEQNKAERERIEAVTKMGAALEQPTRKAVAQAQVADGPDAGTRQNGEPTSSADEYEAVFRKWFRHGKTELSREERAILKRGAASAAETEQRALGDNPQTITTTGGGHAVPDAPMAALQENMLAFGGLLGAPITQIQTDGGNPWPVPTVNDTANSGALLAINTATVDAKAAFGQVVFGAHKITSQFILVPTEFMEDVSFDAVDWAMRAIGERIGRGLAPYLVNGDGVAEPGGLDLAASFVTAAGAAAITRADIIDLIHAIDPAYRRSPAFALVTGDSTVAALKKLAVGTSDDRPLWVPSMREGAPDTIEGVPYYIDIGVSSIAAGNRSMYAGDLSKFWLRRAGPVRLARADERFIEKDQVAFIGFARFDSDIIDAGTDPIKYLRHPAS